MKTFYEMMDYLKCSGTEDLIPVQKNLTLQFYVSS